MGAVNTHTPIQAANLTRTFRGGVVAVNGLDLAVERGAVYGLIGRNGAGKTTTLRLLMGLLRPDAGEARLLGEVFWEAPASLRERVAYVPQGRPMPDWMSVEDLCRYAGRLFLRWDNGLAHALARRWELPWNRPIGRLSGGNQRLASVLLALAARPEVLLLDEPAAGLDPVARRDLLACLADALATGEGTTVLLSTHLLGDLERLATHVGILAHGRIAQEGTVEDWKRTMRRVQVVFPGEEVPEGFEIPGTVRVRRLGPVLTAMVRVVDEEQLNPARYWPGARVHVFPLSLEELFVEWFGEEPGAAGGGPDHFPEEFGQPGSVAGSTSNKRVGKDVDPAVVPVGREFD